MKRALVVLVALAACGDPSEPSRGEGPISIDPYFVDLGFVPAGSHALSFRVTNHTTEDAKCNSVLSSCACAVARGRDGFVIASGETRTVEATMFIEPGQSRMATFLFSFEGGAGPVRVAAHARAAGKPRDDLSWDGRLDLGSVSPGTSVRRKLEVIMSQGFAADHSATGGQPPIEWSLYHGTVTRIIDHGLLEERQTNRLIAWAELEIRAVWPGSGEERVVARIGPLPGTLALFRVSWRGEFPFKVQPAVLVLEPTKDGFQGSVSVELPPTHSVWRCATEHSEMSARIRTDVGGHVVIDVSAPYDWDGARAATRLLLSVRGPDSQETVITIPVLVRL